jgi:hypothetical protein
VASHEHWHGEARYSAIPKAASYRQLARGVARNADPPPSVVIRVPEIGTYPFSTVGRLFFRQNGKRFWGTACVIAKRGIYTAARNLWDDGAASTEIEFWLQYENGDCLGRWVPDAATIRFPPQWETERTATFDYAVFGTTVDLPVNTTGALAFGMSRGITAGTPCIAIGYPGEPFDPEVMWQCRGVIDYTLIFLSQMQNRFTDGAGGGPWIVEHAGMPAIVGSMGQLLPAYDAATSPPFDDSVKQLFQTVQDGR